MPSKLIKDYVMDAKFGSEEHATLFPELNPNSEEESDYEERTNET